jgi:acetyl esterase
MPLEKNQSASLPSSYKPDRVWTYRTVGDVELKAHGFLPKDVQPSDRRAAFVFFHPGGWSKGEPAWGYDMCHHYAGFGMVAISFQYRLSAIGGCTPVDAVADVRSAIRWTRQHASTLGIDPNRLLASGVSAGAHLVLCTAMFSLPDDPGDDPAFSPVPNALVLQVAPVSSASDRQFVELLQGRHRPEDYSPASHVRSGLPPMYFIHGTADEIVPYDSVKEFVARMREAGNPCELHAIEGTDHFFTKKSDKVEALKVMDVFIQGLGYVDGRADTRGRMVIEITPTHDRAANA